MRGKDALTELSPVAVRITPAYAGKRKMSAIFEKPIEDHPCICGEK